MPINSQPNDILNTVQLPLLFQTTAQIPSGENIVDAVVTITNAATSDTIEFIDVPFTTSDDTIIFTAIFIINVSGVAKDFFCTNLKPDVFGQLGIAYSSASPDATIDLDVSIEYFKENSDGIRVTTGIVDNAVQIKIVNATRQHCEEQNLDDYTANSGRKFLTNRPLCVPICLNDDDFISYYNQDIDQFKIETFDSQGDLIETGVVDLSPGSSGNIDTFGSGVVNINSIGAWFSGGVTIDYNVKHYTIAGGFNNVGVFSRKTEFKRYVIVECCEETKCRLFWYNRLGGADGYTFRNIKLVLDQPVSQNYEKYLDPLSTNRIADYGKQKLNSTDTRIYQLQTNIIDTEFSDWLNELQTSIRVYKYKDGECVSILVEDVENEIINEPNGIMSRIIRFQPSVSSIIQNNL